MTAKDVCEVYPPVTTPSQQTLHGDGSQSPAVVRCSVCGSMHFRDEKCWKLFGFEVCDRLLNGSGK